MILRAPIRFKAALSGDRRSLGPLARVSRIAITVWFVGCGGGAAPEPQTAQQADSEPTESDASTNEGDAEEAEGSEDSAPPDPCADGGCFSCGKSLCLSGWYCDEAAQGGAACSWLPECAKTPSCKCIGKVLGAECSCKDEGGGPRVSCK